MSTTTMVVALTR